MRSVSRLVAPETGTSPGSGIHGPGRFGQRVHGPRGLRLGLQHLGGVGGGDLGSRRCFGGFGGLYLRLPFGALGECTIGRTARNVFVHAVFARSRSQSVRRIVSFPQRRGHSIRTESRLVSLPARLHQDSTKLSTFRPTTARRGRQRTSGGFCAKSGKTLHLCTVASKSRAVRRTEKPSEEGLGMGPQQGCRLDKRARRSRMLSLFFDKVEQHPCLPFTGGDWFRHGMSEPRSRSWSPRHVKQGYRQFNWQEQLLQRFCAAHGCLIAPCRQPRDFPDPGATSS